jgi:hypothetical protein
MQTKNVDKLALPQHTQTRPASSLQPLDPQPKCCRYGATPRAAVAAGAAQGGQLHRQLERCRQQGRLKVQDTGLRSQQAKGRHCLTSSTGSWAKGMPLVDTAPQSDQLSAKSLQQHYGKYTTHHTHCLDTGVRGGKLSTAQQTFR